MTDRIRLDFDNATGPEWVASYYLSDTEYDDTMEDDNTQEVIFNAVDFDTAVRYAQQYLRKKQSETDTWATAEILSVERY